MKKCNAANIGIETAAATFGLGANEPGCCTGIADADAGQLRLDAALERNP